MQTCETISATSSGKRAAIGVAQHDPAGAMVERGSGAGQGVVRIGLVAVEEMLAVDHRFALALADRIDAVGDRLDVFLVRDPERHIDMVVPGFLRPGRRHRPLTSNRAASPGSLAALRPARLVMPKAVKVAFLNFGFVGEEIRIRGIGAGIAALHIIDAEAVKHAGDQDLVLDREVDPVGLRPVAQGGVEEIQPLTCPWRSSCELPCGAVRALSLRTIPKPVS